MELGLRGKTALVAAASSGLGYAVALRLAAEGARVAICARSEERITRAAERIRRETGASVLPVVADLTRRGDVERFVEAARRELGPVSILVTNTGGPPSGPPLSFSDDDWEAAFQLVFYSALRLIRSVLPDMEERGWGRVVALTSISVKQPIDTLVLSNATRSALTALMKTLSTVYASRGITFNTVAPGPIATSRMEQLIQAAVSREGLSPEEALSRWIGDIPMGRLGKPEELADLVAFLCSERAGFITGATIPVDGGAVKGLF
ncbi:SDR family oxidoreductase [Spirochaeta thermophila]|uniref:Short-chain dehydrogenase/reductase SDR n=1 Tax=Winmispira thermophila (strain ATCC 49972 / DSM 6192 / RI 19.B1) TaxID=665571 RepID=E0RSY6_WINT6|nr:SDR family oxidoreductase [Spirochaeta thermophila]ADN02123.1 hypothetical protein STHERM_c11820 [Spirochaeta thermophila DSM 6192]